jgi:hypothetical protein
MSLFPDGLFPGGLFPDGLFSEGERRKELVLQQLQLSNADALKHIREELADLYRARVDRQSYSAVDISFVTADDARRAYNRLQGRPLKTAFLGAVFKSAEWEWTGRMVKSARASRHSGLLYCWKLKGG